MTGGLTMVRISAALVALATLAAAGSAAAQGPEHTYRSTNFSVTWSEETDVAPDPRDSNSDDLPDAVVRLARVFEDARTFLLADLGYREPPGEHPYQLYVVRDGGYVRPTPGGTERSRPSFIAVPARLVQTGVTPKVLRSFAVHEYMHAVQHGYEDDAPDWIKEATSAWVEDVFFDGASPNHRYLEWFVPYPRLGLTSDEGFHEYGAFLFLQFITERVGGGSVTGAHLVRELWERLSEAPGTDVDALDALRTLLNDRGWTFEEVWREFMYWRWDLLRFEEGESYRAATGGRPRPSVVTRFVGESCRLETGELPAVSGDYMSVVPRSAGSSRVTTVSVTGLPGTNAFALIARDRVTVPERVDLDLDEQGTARVMISPGLIRRITLGLVNASIDEPASIAYSVRREGRSRVAMTDILGSSATDYGTSVRLSGSILCANSPAKRARLTLSGTDANGVVTSQALETDENGIWAAGVDPSSTTTYRVSLIDPLLSSASTPDFTIEVRVVVTLDLDRDQLGIGEPVVARGDVAPAHPDAQVVLEYRRPEGTWVMADEEIVGHDGYEMTFVPPATGIWEIRVRSTTTGDEDHEPGVSPTRLISVGSS